MVAMVNVAEQGEHCRLAVELAACGTFRSQHPSSLYAKRVGSYFVSDKVLIVAISN